MNEIKTEIKPQSIRISQNVAILVDGNNIERSIRDVVGDANVMPNFDTLVPRLLGERGLNRLVYFREGKNISDKLRERLHSNYHGSVRPCHKSADIPLTIKATQLASKVDTIIINANRNQSLYEKYGFPVVADQIEGYCGPLAGMASGLQAAKTPFVVTVPCDSPLIPVDLVQKLYSTLQDEDAEICTAHSNGRLQPVFTVMKTEVLSSMLDFLNNGERKIDKWFEQHRLAIADFSEQPDTFININSAEELAEIELKLK